MTFSSSAGRQVRARVAAGGAVLRLVLHGQRVNVHALGAVGGHELQEVQGVGEVDLRVVDHRPPMSDRCFVQAGGLHGVAIMVRRGLISATLAGRTCASSWATEKCCWA